ncbi:hypothetical protein L228DRAFT_245712 [Xylona heveae TC161]|uniref:Uncharacterized protein n=1 Tax=Xylona heveae (strain CBS 132557 / TC161) TaxID=1328760 RepID=A0A165ID18_XYLHT|nr:hypothetical protein L228DRAFT_245712 [Xylona heveae TC161]KZF24725.1 hypothetical protein L228DRAFT_245712 [Xylona heveae TC161]
MTPMLPEQERPEYDTLRECLSTALIQQSTATSSTPSTTTTSTKVSSVSSSGDKNAVGSNAASSRRRPGRKTAATEQRARVEQKNEEKEQQSRPENAKHSEDDDASAEELADFIDYIATEIFSSLPLSLQTLSSSSPSSLRPTSLSSTNYDISDSLTHDDENISNEDLDSDNDAKADALIGAIPGLLSTLPPSISESLTAYGYTTSSSSLYTPPSKRKSRPSKSSSPPSSLSLSSASPHIPLPTATAFLTALYTDYIRALLPSPSPPPTLSKRYRKAGGGGGGEDEDGYAALQQKRQKPTHCELCDRDWVPLTEHHLVPRSVQQKALKRGWHAAVVTGSTPNRRGEDGGSESRYWTQNGKGLGGDGSSQSRNWTRNEKDDEDEDEDEEDEEYYNMTEAERVHSTCYICRACHSFVHKVATNEELGKSWYTVRLLLDREDVQRWVGWVGRVRWKKT